MSGMGFSNARAGSLQVLRVSEMDHLEKAFVANPEDPSSISEPHMI